MKLCPRNPKATCRQAAATRGLRHGPVQVLSRITSLGNPHQKVWPMIEEDSRTSLANRFRKLGKIEIVTHGSSNFNVSSVTNFTSFSKIIIQQVLIHCTYRARGQSKHYLSRAPTVRSVLAPTCFDGHHASVSSRLYKLNSNKTLRLMDRHSTDSLEGA